MKIVPISQLDTNNPGTWPIYYQVILWAVMVLAMVFGYNKLMREEIIMQQTQNEETMNGLKDKHKKLFQETLDLPKYQQRNDELIALLKGKLKYLPSDEEMPALIKNVYDSATKNQINFNLISPNENMIKESYYNIKPIRLNVQTQYGNFAKFVQDISELERILNVSDMTIKLVKGDANLLDIDSSLQTYIYSPGDKALFTADDNK
ncbi:MAG: type 4a pilus biogenesis protein PilO [Cardiobacteriaceae bacterium]|nr:type 4a pilus biogenesis protein PilO [Cardiobacteriaceae bacterium]